MAESASSHTSQGDGSQHFIWSNTSSRPVIQTFDDFGSGISSATLMTLNEDSSELDIFLHFFDEGLINQIVINTNRYHQHFLRTRTLKVYSRLHKWYDVTVPEMYVFFAVTMLFTRNKHLSMEEHWSTDPLLNAPIFSKLMSRNRYFMILGMLHFGPHDTQFSDTLKVSKIRSLVEYVRKKFKNSFIPHSNLCIDESVVPFKGRLNIRQFLPKKRNRFGVKMFVLCDVKSKVILDFIVYAGKETPIIDQQNLGVSGAVVVTLLQDYLDTNRKLYVDNWYSSPQLFRYLYQRGIVACGTVRKNRSGMPKFEKIKKGEICAKYCPPLMALQWYDKKLITMLSTMHDHTFIPCLREDRESGLPVLKPECIVDYNINMGTVDIADMMLSSLHCMRKSIKWNKKFSFHVVDMLILNSFYFAKILKNNADLRFSTFQLNLIRQIIEKFKPHISSKPTVRQANVNNPLRLLSNNSADHMPTQNDRKQRCKYCAHNNRRRETMYTDNVCKVNLCVLCFKKYHQDQSFK